LFSTAVDVFKFMQKIMYAPTNGDYINRYRFLGSLFHLF
jgi:hypothetical protein